MTQPRSCYLHPRVYVGIHPKHKKMMMMMMLITRGVVCRLPPPAFLLHKVPSPISSFVCWFLPGLAYRRSTCSSQRRIKRQEEREYRVVRAQEVQYDTIQQRKKKKKKKKKKPRILGHRGEPIFPSAIPVDYLFVRYFVGLVPKFCLFHSFLPSYPVFVIPFIRYATFLLAGLPSSGTPLPFRSYSSFVTSTRGKAQLEGGVGVAGEGGTDQYAEKEKKKRKRKH